MSTKQHLSTVAEYKYVLFLNTTMKMLLKKTS